MASFVVEDQRIGGKTMLEDSIWTFLRYAVIALAAVCLSERGRVEANRYAWGFDVPRIRDGWAFAMRGVLTAHLLGTLSPIPFSAIQWLSLTKSGEWFVVWPRLIGITGAWMVAAWYGWYHGCRERSAQITLPVPSGSK